MKRRYDMMDTATIARDARNLDKQLTIIGNLNQVYAIVQSLEDKAKLKLMIAKAENESIRLRKRLGGVTI